MHQAICYAHTNNEERQLLAQKVDEKFFQKPLLEAAPPAGEMQKVLQILAEKPELMKLLAAMQRGARGNLLEDLLETAKSRFTEKRKNPRNH